MTDNPLIHHILIIHGTNLNKEITMFFVSRYDNTFSLDIAFVISKKYCARLTYGIAAIILDRKKSDNFLTIILNHT